MKRDEQLRALLEEMQGCFHAASAEGLEEKMRDDGCEVGSIADIVQRRLLWIPPLVDQALALLNQSAAGDELTAADYEATLADHRRLVRELDVALNGDEGAAKQASLCDIVRQVKSEGIKARQPGIGDAGGVVERWAVWWQGSGPERGDHIMALTASGLRYSHEVAYIGDQHHDAAGKLVSAHNASLAAFPALPQPPGFRLVPGEITLEMQKAYFEVIDRNMPRVQTDATFGRFSSNAEAYRAMLAAAPLPTAPKQEG